VVKLSAIAKEEIAMATTSISASTLKVASLGSSFASGENGLLVKSVPTQARIPSRPIRFRPMMKNVNEGKGLFAPIVVVTKNILGQKRFNQIRGKAIALHSQVSIYHMLQVGFSGAFMFF